MVLNDESPGAVPETSPETQATTDTSAANSAQPAAEVAPAGATGSGPTAELTTDAAMGNSSPELAAELADMASALERFHARAEQYESIIRRMQSRIEELQADQVRELLKPLILKLASLHTAAIDAERRASTREDDASRRDFDYFVSEIEETLSLLDIESIGVSVLDEFDAARHAARRRVDTDDASLDRRIAKVIRQGFTYVGAERVFIPAQVTVYRHTSDSAEPATSAEDIAESAS